MKNILTIVMIFLLSVNEVFAGVVRPRPRPPVVNQECPEQDTENQCMACAVYHEARGENEYGQMAVAVVILNRVASDRFPDTVCEVVWQKGYVSRINRWIGQFSFTTDGKSDFMYDRDSITDVNLVIDQIVKLYNDENELQNMLNLTHDVLWYHTETVDPSWNDVYTPVVQIGTHRFYKS